MIVDIIPAKKLPKNLSVLSYKIPNDLEAKVRIGQIAAIPLRNSFTSGAITAIKKTLRTPYPLKYITGLASEKPIFTLPQLKLFRQLAEYYYTSASLFVHFNLPKLIKKDWQKLPARLRQGYGGHARLNAPTVNRHKTAKPSFLWWQKTEERNKFYLKQIQTAKKSKFQLLIIVPRINDISALAKQLALKSTEYIPIHRQLSRLENFKVWLAANRQLSALFIGSRSSLFCPFANLRTIIIDDEHSLDHKQYDMNPRYETKVVAEKLGQICKNKIIYSSPAPSLVSYHELQLKAPQFKRTIISADLNNELTKKNFSFISEQLDTHLKHTLNSKKSIFLFVNKKGEATSTACQDCGFTFTCPSCTLPLIKTNNQFVCYYCDHQEDMPPFCPKCSGPNFHSLGLGIQKVEANLKKLFPESKILRLDKDITKLAIADYQSPAAIIIGTEYALDKINWADIGLLGIINADSLWQHAEFISAETAYQLLIKLLTLAPKNANIIIQTFQPNHYLIQSIIQNKPEIFYQNESAFRQKFSYPPFAQLVKLSCLNKSEAATKKEAEKIYQRLKGYKNIESQPPLSILRRKIRGKYKFNIILKLKNLDDFKPLAKIIPNDWLIDIHPRTLLD
ncbi:primosomal protein N' [Candidatus Kuenenbacteria bacterium CG10_big_fil_rev_8_21_14_0_10_39_14]|uniref:Primosomal protein N n=3 Tax=Candidatus Kueneniibacteriota TaxID=1752740 RepID=A0A2H0U4U8_9BACT|nr:MAG: primosomal protein N' [Candidatus Kuenenbacteria bacterium CG23_combo_of_CG06-09_8_20_14_all_39_39]PIR80490.1 MAG: primosomal protein N' [Candidatus Kuenenbacteria bacterium CG10_big_fil_rev_8_21_14_0_10_39_14]